MKWWLYCDRCNKYSLFNFHIVNIYKNYNSFFCKKCIKELLIKEQGQRITQFEKSIKFYRLLQLL